MRTRIGDPVDRHALRRIGGPDGDIAGGLVFAPARDLGEWRQVEDELTEAFLLSREAMAVEAPVVYLLRSPAILGRSGPLDSAVAAGLVGGARALAFEGRRRGRYATVIGVDGDEPPDRVAEAVTFALTTRAAAGQVVMLGHEHLGAMLP
ncbi:hypothetical protein GCM10010377_75200 [Streptomyces viridiviolaceus]|uniref:Uncharacterized protein n=1 Tax=Streptomyces viridiviolaceus TaxID=68282 RepID=A0ABW2EA50_9ACTN|nr:hypothetical protein [Streptomyces viridiviolaceus]GHB73762.1 hypothetical protein GCM10010377_75200 [Streptomyces viridiviolaceus]